MSDKIYLELNVIGPNKEAPIEISANKGILVYREAGQIVLNVDGKDTSFDVYSPSNISRREKTMECFHTAINKGTMPTLVNDSSSNPQVKVSTAWYFSDGGSVSGSYLERGDQKQRLTPYIEQTNKESGFLALSRHEERPRVASDFFPIIPKDVIYIGDEKQIQFKVNKIA